MFKKFFFSLSILLFINNLNSKPIDFEGLSKLNYNDIQSITSIDIYDNKLEINDVNILLKELSLSDLIYSIEYRDENDQFIFKIEESKQIENIFINNNLWIKDELILQNIKSRNNSLLIKNNIKNDIKVIKNIYKSKGFLNVTVIAKIEKYSQDRVNLIYKIDENQQQKLNIIKFLGNSFFSDNFLNTKIKSESIKFYNIFKSGSNLNYYTFEFDKNNIISTYKDEGFLNVKVSYALEKTSLNNNILYFYINEGERKKINNINFDFNENVNNDIFDDIKIDFNNDLKKNNYFYSKSLIDKYVENFNLNLISNNIHNLSIGFSIFEDNNNINLSFLSSQKDPIVINKIDIAGNTITKNNTIRSKISIEPGEYLNQYMLDKSVSNLKRYPYIKDVNTTININNQLADIAFKIDEEVKTGNILLAGTFNADTGAGLSFGIEDKNLFGSGNSISSNFTINSEDLKFSINYKQYPILNPDLTNNYTIYNQDNDYTGSFGYKASTRGIGYSVNFKQNDKISYSTGLKYEVFKGHSAVNTSSSSINDNIGNFENYKINFTTRYDTTNNYLYPTNGHLNIFSIIYSPKDVSDNAFYKLSLKNNNYFQLPKTENYLFFNNKYGYAKSLNSKLKTIDAFYLGGMNFRGFDYKGIGPYDGNIYLGGNEYFTSTIGYGSSFIFDDKDNINIKFFLTTGSIWNSDYVSSDIDMRSSIGTSLDFITPIGPLSFSYSSPIEKNNSDKTRSFDFSLGTSF
tara:strand:+ start:173 stop:2404 length:2232 start_codon:yes stop_codon:yes gene_type:complete